MEIPLFPLHGRAKVIIIESSVPKLVSCWGAQCKIHVENIDGEYKINKLKYHENQLTFYQTRIQS